MRLLFMTDIHSATKEASLLAAKAEQLGADLILIGGDFSNSGSLKIAEEIISLFGSAKLFAVPGNMDSPEIADFLRERGVSIHRDKQRFMGYTFIGLGGGKPVNTYYRLNISEPEAEKQLKRLSEGEEPEKTIIVSHTPPYGTPLSLTYSGTDLGLRALAAFTERFRPALVLCGHVHEAHGSVKAGKTLCVNPGPLSEGRYAVAEVSGKSVSVRAHAL
jgi:Icc-related predicted phosphoesterase